MLKFDVIHVKVRCHPRDGLVDSLENIIDCERRRVTSYTQDSTRMVFQGDKHGILP